MAGMRFVARIEPVAPAKSDAWLCVAIPEALSRRLPSRGNVPIAGTIGGFAFRTSAFPDGKGSHTIMVNKAMREGAGVARGDTVTVLIDVDTASREPVVATDVKRALAAHAKARAQWKTLTPRCRAEWIGHLDEAKRPETRARRLGKMLERLATGFRRVSD